MLNQANKLILVTAILSVPQITTAAILTSGNLDFGVDKYGAIGSNFTDSTRLNNATHIPTATSDNPSLIFAGFLYFSGSQSYIGDDANGFKARSQASLSMPTITTTANSTTSSYTTSISSVDVNVTVKTTADGNGGITQKYTLSNTSATNLTFDLAYLLDMDIGADESDDFASVDATTGIARAWDIDFANPGSAIASSFSSPLFSVKTNSSATAGLVSGGSTPTLAAIDAGTLTAGTLSGADFALAFDYGSINLNAGDNTIINLKFASGGTVVPVPAALWLFGSGLLGIVGFARRKG